MRHRLKHIWSIHLRAITWNANWDTTQEERSKNNKNNLQKSNQSFILNSLFFIFSFLTRGNSVRRSADERQRFKHAFLLKRIQNFNSLFLIYLFLLYLIKKNIPYKIRITSVLLLVSPSRDKTNFSSITF